VAFSGGNSAFSLARNVGYILMSDIRLNLNSQQLKADNNYRQLIPTIKLLKVSIKQQERLLQETCPFLLK